MSPAPGAASAPALVSLLDLSVEAPLLRGLSLVSQARGDSLAGAPRTSCPGIRGALGWTLRNVTGFRVNTEDFYIVVSQFRDPH